MDQKDKKAIKKIWEDLSVHCETLEKISTKEQNKEVHEDDDWDPVPDILEEASSLLFKCYYKLEEVVNS